MFRVRKSEDFRKLYQKVLAENTSEIALFRSLRKREQLGSHKSFEYLRTDSFFRKISHPPALNVPTPVKSLARIYKGLKAEVT